MYLIHALYRKKVILVSSVTTLIPMYMYTQYSVAIFFDPSLFIHLIRHDFNATSNKYIKYTPRVYTDNNIHINQTRKAPEISSTTIIRKKSKVEKTDRERYNQVYQRKINLNHTASVLSEILSDVPGRLFGAEKTFPPPNRRPVKKQSCCVTFNVSKQIYMYIYVIYYHNIKMLRQQLVKLHTFLCPFTNFVLTFLSLHLTFGLCVFLDNRRFYLMDVNFTVLI